MGGGGGGGGGGGVNIPHLGIDDHSLIYLSSKKIFGPGTGPHMQQILLMLLLLLGKKHNALHQFASDRDETLYSDSKRYSPPTDGVRFFTFRF